MPFWGLASILHDNLRVKWNIVLKTSEIRQMCVFAREYESKMKHGQKTSQMRMFELSKLGNTRIHVGLSSGGLERVKNGESLKPACVGTPKLP